MCYSIQKLCHSEALWAQLVISMLLHLFQTTQENEHKLLMDY